MVQILDCTLRDGEGVGPQTRCCFFYNYTSGGVMEMTQDQYKIMQEILRTLENCEQVSAKTYIDWLRILKPEEWKIKPAGAV